MGRVSKIGTVQPTEQFIIEIDRVDRNLMNMYYKARLCRRNIDMNWKRGNQIKEEYEGALIQNKR